MSPDNYLLAVNKLSRNSEQKTRWKNVSPMLESRITDNQAE
jgi:hypothetical protein